jgi:hypothetical protein
VGLGAEIDRGRAQRARGSAFVLARFSAGTTPASLQQQLMSDNGGARREETALSSLQDAT